MTSIGAQPPLATQPSEAAPSTVAHQLHTWAGEQSVPIAFTQWIAASLRHPYTEPVVTSAYVARLPEAATLERLGLRPVTDAGKVWLLVPDDEGVFLETQTVQESAPRHRRPDLSRPAKDRIARPRPSRRLAQLGRLLPQMKLGAYTIRFQRLQIQQEMVERSAPAQSRSIQPRWSPIKGSPLRLRNASHLHHIPQPLFLSHIITPSVFARQGLRPLRLGGQAY